MNALLQQHRYAGVWLSAGFSGFAAVIALFALLRQPTRGAQRNRNAVTMGVGLLLLLAALIAPDLDSASRIVEMAPGILLLAAINVRENA